MGALTKTSRVDFERIEVGVLGNCRENLTRIDELAADIKERGLLQPMIVWHKRQRREPFTLLDGREVWDRYILIGGNRRYAAITLIREDDPDAFDTIPVTLLRGNEDDALFAQLAENLQREDLTLIELANAVFAMRSRGHNQATIAKRLAKSQAWISRLLRLRENAAEALLRAVGSGEIPFNVALVLSDKEERAQLRELERFRARVEQVGKANARRELDASNGKPRRPPAKMVRSQLERLGTIPRTQRNTRVLDLAEQILAWSLGEADWPDTIPLPNEEDAA